MMGIVELIRWNLAHETMQDVEAKQNNGDIWFIFRHEGEVTHAKKMAASWAEGDTARGGYALMLLHGSQNISPQEIPLCLIGEPLPFDDQT